MKDYKTTIRCKLMDWMQKKKVAKRWEIIEKIREIQGHDFNLTRDRGYYACALQGSIEDELHQSCCLGYLRRPTKNDTRYLSKIADGFYCCKKA